MVLPLALALSRPDSLLPSGSGAAALDAARGSAPEADAPAAMEGVARRMKVLSYGFYVSKIKYYI